MLLRFPLIRRNEGICCWNRAPRAWERNASQEQSQQPRSISSSRHGKQGGEPAPVGAESPSRTGRQRSSPWVHLSGRGRDRTHGKVSLQGSTSLLSTQQGTQHLISSSRSPAGQPQQRFGQLSPPREAPGEPHGCSGCSGDRRWHREARDGRELCTSSGPRPWPSTATWSCLHRSCPGFWRSPRRLIKGERLQVSLRIQTRFRINLCRLQLAQRAPTALLISYLCISPGWLGQVNQPRQVCLCFLRHSVLQRLAYP